MGRTISTELCVNLSPRGLVLGLAGTGGVVGVLLGGGYQLLVAPPWPVFCDDVVIAVHFWVAPQPIGGCEAVAADM